MDLEPGDLICCLERGLLTSLSRKNVLSACLVDSADNRRVESPRVDEMHGALPTLAHTAIGAALANKTAGNEKIALVYSAGPNSAAVREAINIARVHSLPIVFVHHLDGESPQARSDAPNGRKKDRTEEIPWFPVITVDTHDVVAVYRVAYEAISRARSGQGPTVIECQPFLPTGRTNSPNGVLAPNPVANMEHYLRAKGLFDPKLKRHAAAEQ